ncbi:hypothetical protein GCM10009839_36060 [Catenulispora yoronensis]|uniref:Secreted peptide n=1 Tax=Catenulispora yoronensis TaxID=450799 RepID=A0ABN2U9M3_9ACTN
MPADLVLVSVLVLVLVLVLVPVSVPVAVGFAGAGVDLGATDDPTGQAGRATCECVVAIPTTMRVIRIPAALVIMVLM